MVVKAQAEGGLASRAVRTAAVGLQMNGRRLLGAVCLISSAMGAHMEEEDGATEAAARQVDCRLARHEVGHLVVGSISSERKRTAGRRKTRC